MTGVQRGATEVTCARTQDRKLGVPLIPGISREVFQRGLAHPCVARYGIEVEMPDRPEASLPLAVRKSGLAKSHMAWWSGASQISGWPGGRSSAKSCDWPICGTSLSSMTSSSTPMGMASGPSSGRWCLSSTRPRCAGTLSRGPTCGIPKLGVSCLSGTSEPRATSWPSCAESWGWRKRC